MTQLLHLREQGEVEAWWKRLVDDNQCLVTLQDMQLHG